MLSKIISICVSSFVLIYGIYDCYNIIQIHSVYKYGVITKAVIQDKPTYCQLGYRLKNEIELRILDVKKKIYVGYDMCAELKKNETVQVRTNKDFEIVLLYNKKDDHFKKENYVFPICLIILGCVFIFFTLFSSQEDDDI